MIPRIRFRLALARAFAAGGSALAVACALAVPLASADSQLLGQISPGQGPGWSDLVVPRTTPDATIGMPLTTPPQLIANQPVYLNWAVSYNAAITGTWVDALSLDERLISARPHYNGVFAGGTAFALNDGPVVVPGGRHTFTVNADVYRETYEDYLDRYDNIQDVSFIWQPPALPPNATWTLYPPPLPGDGPAPNCTAYAIAPPPDSLYVVAAASQGATLVCFDDYVDSKHGLTHEIARSESGLDTVEVMAGVAGAGAVERYPGVFLPDGSAPSATSIQWNLSGGRVIDGPDQVSAVNLLPTGVLAHAWRVWLVAGQFASIELEHYSGLPDPAAEIALFPPGPGLRSRREALAVSHRAPASDRSRIEVVPSETGWYPLAVHKLVSGYVGDFYYRIRSGTEAIGVGDPPPPGSLALRAVPSPATTATAISFGLAQPGHARLAIFDLAGRLRRVLLDGALPVGMHSVAWDLRDDGGAALGAGVYWARLELDTGTTSTRIVIAGD
jgi:hypothetical protein